MMGVVHRFPFEEARLEQIQLKVTDSTAVSLLSNHLRLLV
jgi:hypothetical protein